MDTAFFFLLASSEAPEGTERWLTIFVFVIGVPVLVMQFLSYFRGTKIQQPLEFSSTQKYATADAFSRHCAKQEGDLQRIAGSAESGARQLTAELHSLGVQVAEIAAHSETNMHDMKRVESRLDRLEHKLDDLISRLSKIK